MRHRLLLFECRLVVAILLFMSIFACGRAVLVIHYPNGTSISFPAIPVKFQGNSREFAPIYNVTFSGRADLVRQVMWIRFQGWKNGDVENELIRWKNLVGYMENIDNGIDTSYITCPVVEIGARAYCQLRDTIAAYGSVNLTITNDTPLGYAGFAYSWWFIFFSVTVGVFSFINIYIATVVILRLGIGRQVRTLCIGLDLFACFIRILFCIDPFAGWNALPTVATQFFLSFSWPLSLIGTLMLTFFWSDLISSATLGISPVLTRSKKPALIAAVLLVLLEVITVSLRLTQTTMPAVVLANSLVYLIVVVVLLIHFIYVSVKVFAVMKGISYEEHYSQRQLVAFTIRAVFCTLGFLGLIVAGILGSTYIETDTIDGPSRLQYVIMQSLNFMDLMTILAFMQTSRPTGNEFGRSIEHSSSGPQQDTYSLDSSHHYSRGQIDL